MLYRKLLRDRIAKHTLKLIAVWEQRRTRNSVEAALARNLTEKIILSPSISLSIGHMVKLPIIVK